MLAFTHLAWGLSAALWTADTGLSSALAPFIIAGAAGALMPDIDCTSRPEIRDAGTGAAAALAVIGGAAAADVLTGGYFIRSFSQMPAAQITAALCCFIVVCLLARLSRHRGFSHSLAALALECFALQALHPALPLPYAAAGLTHLLLDLTNKKKLRLFFPFKKGFAFGLWHADRKADRVFLILGICALIISVIIKR